MMRSVLSTVAQAIVAVECKNSTGSGVLIHLGQARGLILTCSHDLAAEELRVTYRDNGKFFRIEAKIIARDERADLALLGVECENLPRLSLGEVEPDLQEEVCVAGNPNTLFGLSVEGRIQGKVGRGPKARCLVTTSGVVASGISGGAVANDHGEIVGIMVSGPHDEEVPMHGIGFFVTLPTIRKFLRAVQAAHKGVKST